MEFDEKFNHFSAIRGPEKFACLGYLTFLVNYPRQRNEAFLDKRHTYNHGGNVQSKILTLTILAISLYSGRLYAQDCDWENFEYEEVTNEEIIEGPTMKVSQVETPRGEIRIETNRSILTKYVDIYWSQLCWGDDIPHTPGVAPVDGGVHLRYQKVRRIEMEKPFSIRAKFFGKKEIVKEVSLLEYEGFIVENDGKVYRDSIFADYLTNEQITLAIAFGRISEKEYGKLEVLLGTSLPD